MSLIPTHGVCTCAGSLTKRANRRECARAMLSSPRTSFDRLVFWRPIHVSAVHSRQRQVAIRLAGASAIGSEASP